jgi:hypothetical protein
MKKALLKGTALGALILTGSLAAGQAALADEYEVTIQNLTHGQPIAPSLFVTHDSNFSLFDIGPAADMDSDQYIGLATAAETGNPGVLDAAIDGDGGVEDHVVLAHPNGPGVPPVLFPGTSNSLADQMLDPIVGTPGKYFSAVAMLGGTNDAFYGLRNVVLPASGSSTTVRAVTYDAGSEANSEALDDVPPGGNMDEADDGSTIAENGEGYIHIHNGIHGLNFNSNGKYLNPAQWDWGNEVVEITITNITPP